MHLLGQRTLGIIMLLLLSMLVMIKCLATGSLLEYKLKDNLWAWLTNNFNLFFLLVVNPAAAVLLITRHLEVVDPTHLSMDIPQLMTGLEIGGMGLYGLGYLLMAWALVSLGGNYQLGGSTPRAADEMVMVGPYRFIRHPMYTAALSISLGLACLVQSLALFFLFGIYLVLIHLLIPVEEAGLRRAYGVRYTSYEQKAKKVIPFFY